MWVASTSRVIVFWSMTTMTSLECSPTVTSCTWTETFSPRRTMTRSTCSMLPLTGSFWTCFGSASCFSPPSTSISRSTFATRSASWVSWPGRLMCTGSAPWPYSTAGTWCAQRRRRAAPLPNSERCVALRVTWSAMVILLNLVCRCGLPRRSSSEGGPSRSRVAGNRAAPRRGNPHRLPDGHGRTKTGWSSGLPEVTLEELPLRFRVRVGDAGRLALTQLDATDLAVDRLRQLVDELDDPHPLVGAEPLTCVLEDLLGRVLRVGRDVSRERHERLRHREPYGIGAGHDGDLGHVRVLQQDRLQLERRDLVVGRLEHVVGAADVRDVAVCVSGGDVASVVVAVATCLGGHRGVGIVTVHQAQDLPRPFEGDPGPDGRLRCRPRNDRRGVSRRLLPHRRHRLPRRGRLPHVRRPLRRRVQGVRLQDLAVRARVDPAGAPVRDRGRHRAQPRSRTTRGAEGIRDARAGHRRQPAGRGEGDLRALSLIHISEP